MTLLSSDPIALQKARNAIAAGRAEAHPWAIVGFLFAFMLINYADRAVLGLAAEPLMRDLALTPRQFGMVGSAFFLFYSIAAIILGFAINRVQTRWMLFILVMVWSAAQLPMAFAASFSVLLISRMLLGAGEGPAYPAAIHSVFKWFPDARRTLPTAVITQGSAAGVIIAAPLLNWVIINYSWQMAFGALGVVGVLWGLAWLAFSSEGPISTNVTSGGKSLERAPYARLLFNPTILCTWFATFAAYWALAMLLVWFPSYLRVGLGFSASSLGFWTTIPWVAGAFVVLGVGYLSQRLLLAGYSSRLARAVVVCAAGLGSALCLVALPFVESAAMKLTLVCVGLVLPNAIIVPAQAIMGEVSPVAQRGAILAIGNAVAGCAGVVAPYVTGAYIEGAPTALAGYESAFFVCALVVGAANLLGMIFIRPDAQAAKLAELSAAR